MTRIGGWRLEKVRSDARGLRGDFEEAVRHLAKAIVDLDEYAPKKPHRSWSDRLMGVLGDVAEVGFRLTPVGTLVTAVQAADWLFEEFGSVLSEVSDLMSSMSSFLGFASTLFIWAPGVGQGLALAALATAGGAAAFKTGLYLSGAKDQYGRPYVDARELGGAFIDVAIEGAAVGLGAAAATTADPAREAEAREVAARVASTLRFEPLPERT